MRTLYPSGSDSYNDFVYYAQAVRPALHLNLSSAELSSAADFVEVGEIFDEETQSFDSDNVDILLKYILGDGQATFDTSASYRTQTLTNLNTYATSTFTPVGGTATQTGFNAGAMREKRVTSGGTSGSTDYVAKTSGQDIVVTLGGLKWQVEYLSLDKDDNLILTLWLDNCVQEAWTSRSSTEGAYYGFLNGGLFSSYSNGFYDTYGTRTYPSNMYGTSYIHAVTLNNGGTYATSYSASTTATQSTSNVFALYTMSRYGLTDYLVKPSAVSWQEEQSQLGLGGVGYNLSNEAWSSSMTSGFYTNSTYGSMNYASKAGNSNWANGYLWLPSMTETGYSTTYTGMWETSTTQRQNYDGSTITNLGVTGSSGSTDDGTYAYSWTRSGNYLNATSAYRIDTSGLTNDDVRVSRALAVRPALHLNLTAIANHSDSVEVGELFDEDTGEFDSNNISILYKYLTGDSSAKIADVNALATSVTSAQGIRENILTSGTVGTTTYTKKDGSQDIVVTLGGLKWQVVFLSKDTSGDTIVTLWLDSAKQDKWLDNDDQGDPFSTGFSMLEEQTLLSYYSYGWSEDSIYDMASNMYGVSYIASVILNNGGYCAMNGMNLAGFNQHTTSLFALYTMGDFTDYLVTPEDVDWQWYESAQNVLDYPYNLPNDNYQGLLGSGFYDESFDYSMHQMYGNLWGSHYLWLPSLTEVGNASDNNGLWQTSNSQRFDTYSGKNTWLRSGAENSYATAYTLYASNEATYKANVGSYYAGVRPALHLNLTAIEEKLVDQAKPKGLGDLYDRSTNTVNKTNLGILYRYLSGSASGTLATVNSLISSSGGTVDSSVIRSKSLASGSYGSTTYAEKNAGDDLTVTLAGLKWTAVYLSTDTSGNTILTLWMDDYQDEWKSKSGAGGLFGLSNGVMYSNWSLGWSSTSTSGTYVSNIYGTSYMSNYIFGGGGTVARSTTTSRTGTTWDNPEAYFYYFVGNTNLRNNYLATPGVLSWQGSESAITTFNSEYNMPNESYSTTTDFYSVGSVNLDYSSKTGFDAWKNSYLWLPSLSEVGYDASHTGIFKTSTTMRANTSTSAVSIDGLENAYNYTWTRSGCMYNADTVYAIAPNGSSSRVSYNVGEFAFAVRPCVHVNLTAMSA